ncbi:MAG: hypothetical protein AAF687_02610 [Pseudomonadota bacterium]
MSNISKALLWAAIIIAAALIMSGMSISDAASSGVILGLSGVAWATIATDSGCGRRCPS